MQPQVYPPAITVGAPAAAAPACDYAYYKAAFAGQRLPFAYLDLDLLDENIRGVLARAGGKRVRVATKSVRSVAVLRYILDADPRFQGLMCFTAAEAAWLARQGFDDLLLGYPCSAAADLAEAAEATPAGAHITLMVDSIAHVERAESAARRRGVRLRLCLDLDLALALPALHFGAWRSPVRTAAQARSVIARILASPDVVLDGVMGYEAQVASVADAVPGHWVRNAVIRYLKRRSAAEAARRRAAVVKLIAEMGGTPRFVNGGGTGSVATTCEDPAVTEITVGSAFYAPGLFDHYRDFRYRPAAGFAVEIVRVPRAGTYTCLGGGFVASGAAGPDKLPRPYLPQGARLDPLEGAGEVQTPVHYTGNVPLAMGDPFFFRHAKAGELCERFTHLLLVRQGEVVGRIPTYRGEGQCFL
jgi:D-serine deaminase-like pyridoxal phosphate-dependent protein